MGRSGLSRAARHGLATSMPRPTEFDPLTRMASPGGNRPSSRAMAACASAWSRHMDDLRSAGSSTDRADRRSSSASAVVVADQHRQASTRAASASGSGQRGVIGDGPKSPSSLHRAQHRDAAARRDPRPARPGSPASRRDWRCSFHRSAARCRRRRHGDVEAGRRVPASPSEFGQRQPRHAPRSPPAASDRGHHRQRIR